VDTSGALQTILPTGADTGDLALVRRVQKGDKSAFDALVLKYQHKILMLVRRYVRDPSEAEDVVQDAFIKAYRALPAFRGDSAFYTWMYRIAINTAKNSLVAARRRPLTIDVEAQDAAGAEFRSRLRDTDTPERLLLTEEIRSTVNRAIDGLPEDLRTAIVLRELEGFSYEEIASTMECPVGTVRSRIFRAREAIDRHLRVVFEGGLGRSGEDP
jgi:RNA polymerase sigma-70 factor (ECF subfamily)